MRYLVTGSAGFIGFHVANRLLDEGHEVLGLDGFTDYYDVALKEARNAKLETRNGFQCHRIMLEDFESLSRIWREQVFDIVIHLAGQAGVRYSLENPRSYVDANIVGTFNLLELIRSKPVRHFMFASTSSIYGANSKVPFEERDSTDHPLSVYAASKKAAELISHNYSHLFDIPTTAFRFFTVYGPWGRPDMAFFKFTRNILEGVPIDIYNNGDMQRDFTFVDDIVEAIWRLCGVPPGSETANQASIECDSKSPHAPWRVVNIGRGSPVELMDFVKAIEQACGREAICNFLPMQPGDVPQTYARNELLKELTGFRPSTSLEHGIGQFVSWYREYYAVRR
jgi:UDP-glucuronate 4-epimerase